MIFYETFITKNTINKQNHKNNKKPGELKKNPDILIYFTIYR